MDPLPQPRVDYTAGELDVTDIATDPFVTVRAWLDEAIATGMKDPTAITISTVDDAGVPDARVVLLRGVDARGVSFFTNRESAKGRQLAGTKRAALTWFNTTLERQIRMRGVVSLLPDDESDAYFLSRPRTTRLAAHASNQSEPIESRDALAGQFAKVAADYPDDTPVLRPTFWGGYVLMPDTIEFWQGRRSRMHDRVQLSRDGATWKRQRLQP
ncbi:MAG: pyridoxamine 5'-phosphate oxidase [Nitriliruptoraceae bacterium]